MIARLLCTLVLLVALVCSGCIGQQEQTVQGEFAFADTDLVLRLPDNWQSVAIAGSEWPLLATEIDYGIRPNVRLLKYSASPFQYDEVEAFFKTEQGTDTDYRVLAEDSFSVDGFSSGLKVKATRKNADNIPIVHFSYFLVGDQRSYILYATCAEPSQAQLEPLFDTIIGSARITP